MKHLQVLTCVLLLLPLGIFGQGEPEVQMDDSSRVYTSLKAALQAEEPVYRLHLVRERYRKFPEEIFQFTELRELILDRNKIKEIPSDIVKLTHLEHLSISRNKLTSFPPVVCNLKKLKRLDLSSNDITQIPDEIHRLQKLEVLAIWGNIIGYFPSTLIRLDALRYLDLLHNEMSEQEQERLRNLLPETDLNLSPPCNCTFDDEE